MQLEMVTRDERINERIDYMELRIIDAIRNQRSIEIPDHTGNVTSNQPSPERGDNYGTVTRNQPPTEDRDNTDTCESALEKTQCKTDKKFQEIIAIHHFINPTIHYLDAMCSYKVSVLFGQLNVSNQF